MPKESAQKGLRSCHRTSIDDDRNRYTSPRELIGSLFYTQTEEEVGISFEDVLVLVTAADTIPPLAKVPEEQPHAASDPIWNLIAALRAAFPFTASRQPPLHSLAVPWRSRQHSPEQRLNAMVSCFRWTCISKCNHSDFPLNGQRWLFSSPSSLGERRLKRSHCGKPPAQLHTPMPGLLRTSWKFFCAGSGVLTTAD
ncbi:hypothetical protein HF521_002282 [Silurus meridionalis]|uniref:Uncharacterized protein n=1 Tax=Silurus meridionalis TaxID=175797 RepID=A0A8T0B787_SILME|nr:hypothetical protein HF521_002282 [Silurus meridionalis]